MTAENESNQFAALVADLHAEADRRRRADGQLAALEGDVVAAFRDLAPAGALDDDAAALIDRLEQVGHIDADVPVASRIAPLVPVKRLLRKLYHWYVRYVTDQVTVATSLTGQVLDDHETRIRRLGAAIDPATLGIDPSPALGDATTALITARTTARAFHAWCGAGDLVASLDAAGLDAYGADPDHGLLGDGLRRGLDLRVDDPVTHLHRLSAGVLGTVILGRAIDLAPVGRIVEAIDASARAVGTGGRVIAVVDVGDLDPVRFELLGRAPLSAEAWRRLLTARGLHDVEILGEVDAPRVATGTV